MRQEYWHCLTLLTVRAGYSAEEISVPHQFQPYGDLWAIDIDGQNLIRLTHGAQCSLGAPLGSPHDGTLHPWLRCCALHRLGCCAFHR